MPEFKISIPKPCSQDWNGMAKLDGGGRHCGECKSTVFDFSQMTDQELLDFFKINSGVNCGRFRNTQLDREIIPLPKTDRLLSRANKIAAAALTVLSFKALPTLADKRQTVKEIISFTNTERDSTKTPPDKIIISGTVKGDQGEPLENAKVLLDTLATFTDKDGEFSFELTPDNLIPHNLYFSFEGLLPVVRTYHPIMLSTVFEVSLSAPHPEMYGGTMGVMASFDDSFVFPTIKFRKGTALEKCDIKTLGSFATDLRANLTGTVAVFGYAKSDAQQKIIHKRIKTIIDYLVDKQGLSPERFKQHIYEGEYSDAIEMSAYGYEF